MSKNNYIRLNKLTFQLAAMTALWSFTGSATAQNEFLDSLGYPKDIRHNVERIQIVDKVVADVNSFPVSIAVTTIIPNVIPNVQQARHVFPDQNITINLPAQARVNGFWQRIHVYPNKHAADFVPAISMTKYSETSKETTNEVSLTMGVAVEVEADAIFASTSLTASVEAGFSHSWTSGLTEGQSINVEIPVLPESVLQVWQPVMETHYTFPPQTPAQIEAMVRERLGEFANVYKLKSGEDRRIQQIIAKGITMRDPQNLAIPSYYPHPDAPGRIPAAAVTGAARKDAVASVPDVVAQHTGVDARAVKNVTVAQQGRAIAIYNNNPDGSWSEVGSREDGTTRNFREVRREGSSICLTDGFASIHLDLEKNKVNYTSTAGENIPGLYEIIGYTTR